MSGDEHPGQGREELEAALASLRKVSRSSIGSIVLLALGIFVVVGALVFSLTRLRPLERAVSAKRDTLTELSRQVEDLRVRKAALVAANDTLSAVARHSPAVARSKAVQRVVAAASNARFGVGFYSLGVSEAQYSQLADSIRAHGYTIIQGAPLTERPGWLSPRSTVMYYAPAAAADAEAMAQQLATWTGQAFRTARGAGLGVPRGEERWTFFVHWVGERRPAPGPPTE